MASRPAKKNVPLSKASRNTRKGVESGSIIDYSALTYDSFRVLATASGLSRHERVGFPDSYRVGKEALIYRDIVSKIPCVKSKNLVRVLDIGPGCSNLPLKLLKSVTDRGGELHFVDCAEMLEYLPQTDNVRKWVGRFPNLPELTNTLPDYFDAILVYSVIQYVEDKKSLFQFIDTACKLLAPGGRLLIGDIPNDNMRSRFALTDAGRHFFGRWAKHEGLDSRAGTHCLRIGDEEVLQILESLRKRQLNAWLVPQSLGLPMASRREDILIERAY